MRINPETQEIISNDDYYCPYCDTYLEDDNYPWCDNCNSYVGIVFDEVIEENMTVECLNCGTTNDIRNNSCINCGESPTNNLIRCNPKNSSVEGLEVKCRECGTYNSIDRNTCYNCGKNLNVTLNVD